MRDSGGAAWPDLAFGSLAPTVEVLHLVAQIVGKVRMGLTPWVNHSWHVPLYVSARGLATGWIPADGGALDMEIDLFRGALVVRSAEGSEVSVDLRCETVARIYAETMAALARLGVVIQIDETPCEIPGAIPFPRDLRPRAFDGEAARTYWRALLQAQRVFQRFRTGFVGKCSPVHLFWGSFDLAVTRFSGRPAPPHPGGAEHMPDAVARDGYFQELASAGFWPGAGADLGPAFYAYAYPVPPGYAGAAVAPAAASFSPALGEYLLPYAAVQAAADPDAELMAFLESTYRAAADLAAWDRESLERAEGPIGHPPESV
ncbi:MAG: DUF5996 family protein [Caulobacteraceae bacterium]